jgi:hypothetical protein
MISIYSTYTVYSKSYEGDLVTKWVNSPRSKTLSLLKAFEPSACGKGRLV